MRMVHADCTILQRVWPFQLWMEDDIHLGVLALLRHVDDILDPSGARALRHQQPHHLDVVALRRLRGREEGREQSSEEGGS